MRFILFLGLIGLGCFAYNQWQKKEEAEADAAAARARMEEQAKVKEAEAHAVGTWKNPLEAPAFRDRH